MRQSSTQAIRWGILGTGRMAALMAQELRGLESQGASLAAVASRDPGRASRFATRFGIARAHAGYAGLAHDRAVDIVYIATPPSEHYEQIRLCLETGKSVLCEKPFTTDASQAREVIQLARTRGLFLMEAMWTRFLPASAALRNLMSERAIGRPQLLIGGGAFIPTPEPDHYLFSARLGGGALLDAGVYLVSVASMLLGEARRVHASGDIGKHGVDEHDCFILDHDGGARALLYVSLRARRPPDLEILGDAGSILVAPPVFRPTRLTLKRAHGVDETLEFPPAGSGYGHQLVAAMNALRAGMTETDEMPLDETLSIMTTMDEIRTQLTPREYGPTAADSPHPRG